MAITGRFEADFQSFYAACEKAEAKLADFQSGAGRVETSLNKLVDAFSGRKLIQEVTLSVEAFNRLSAEGKRLTDGELQRLATKATEAVAKMKAMGIEVPPGIQKVADALKPVTKDVGFLGEQFSGLVGKLAGAFAIERVVDFALNIGKAQQALSRLSAETQIGLSDLQDLTGATADYGLANDELAKGLFNVQKAIAGGDASVAVGLHKIGLTIDEVKDKHGKELFLDIERGLAQLQGSLRDSAAADIFGAKLGAAMAGFAKEADAAIAKAEEFNVKLSDEEVANLKNYADEVEHLERNLTALKDKILGGVAGAINGVTEANKNGVKWWQFAAAGAADYFTRLTGGGPGVAMLKLIAVSEAKIAEEQKKVTDGKQQEVVELNKYAQAAQFLFTLQQDAAKKLESYQVRGLEQLRSIGQLNQQNASAIGVSVDQFKKYQEEVRQTETATKALTEATIQQGAQLEKIRSTVTETLTKQRATQTEIELAQIKRAEEAEIQSNNKRAESLKATLIAQHADTVENLAKIEADTAASNKAIQAEYDKLRDGVGVDWDEISTHSQEALDDTAARAKKTFIEALSTVGLTKDEVDKLAQKWRDAEFAATRAGRAMVDGQVAASDSVNNTNLSLEEQLRLQAAIAAKGVDVGGVTSFNKTQFEKDQAKLEADAESIRRKFREQFSGSGSSAGKGSGTGNPKVDDVVAAVAGTKKSSAASSPSPVADSVAAQVSKAGAGFRSVGGAGLQIYAPVSVSGVFDPSSSHALSRVVSDGIFKSVSSARVMR